MSEQVSLTAAELVRLVEQRDGTVEVAGDSLVIRPKRVLTPELVAAMKARKADIIRYLQSEAQDDAQARAAGLLVLVSGRVYYASPSRLAGVFVQRDGDTWEAYAVTWRPARQGTAGELMMAEDRTLYRGRELARALRAAVRWAGGGERP